MGDYKRQHQMPARYFESWNRDEDVERGRRFKPKKRKLKDAVPGYTAWIPLDIYTPNQVTNISAKTSGTVNYSVEYTNEDPFNTGIQQLAVPHPAGSLTAATGDETQFTTTLMRAVRLKINSGNGSVRFTCVQQSTK